MSDRKRSLFWYLLAAASICVTVAAIHLLHADVDTPASSLVVVMLPVMLCCYVGGFGPGAMATVLATALSLALAPPEARDDSVDVVRWVALFAGGLMLSILGESLRRKSRDVVVSNARFRELTEAIEEVFWMVDARCSQTLYVSPAFSKVWGKSIEVAYEEPRSWLVADQLAPLSAGGGRHEYTIVRPDGSTRWVRLTAFAIRDGAAQVVRYAGTITDITNERDLEERLRQTQKMESLGMLAGGVAHDFNNLLAVIATCTGMLADSLATDSPDRELVHEVEGAVQRASALTRQLLAFSRKQVTQPVVIDVNAVITETRKMLRRLVGEDVIITTSLEPELRSVLIDPSNLVQVLMNLAVNARDAMPRGGSLHITTRHDGDDVVVAVKDTGTGMTPEVRARVFEPFFTTKDVGKGTGMGLAVVHGIVDQAGGTLECESEVGVGTTFLLRVPAVATRAVAIGETTLGGHGAEKIIMVDDDEYVRRAASRALRSRGYTVLEARDGTAALQLLSSQSVDLLVTDVVMPGMDGRALADAARVHTPELKVLYMSGYTDDAVLRYGIKHAEVAFLEKPFRVQSLAGRIRQVLDA